MNIDPLFTTKNPDELRSRALVLLAMHGTTWEQRHREQEHHIQKQERRIQALEEALKTLRC